MNNTEKRISVLYVDDEEDNLLAFRASLRHDFDIHVATGAQEALEWLGNNTVHVVISDQRMPGTTGVEFLTKVKEEWPDTIRILLTGYSNIEAVVDAINLGGVHAYVTKPWDPADLRLRVEQAYEIHALRAHRNRLVKRYEQLFLASGDLIMVIDAQGTIREVNPAARQLLQEDLGGVMANEIGHYLNDPGKFLQEVQGLGRSDVLTDLEYTIHAPMGRKMDAMVTVVNIGADPQGAPLYQVMVKDISEIKRREDRLKEMNQELDRRVAERTKQLMSALDDLGAFSYSVAHDLRSPLKNIKVLSEHLSSLTVFQAGAEERDLAQRIHKASSRLIHLVDDLLRFSQTDAREVELEDTDVTVVMQELLQENDPLPDHIQVHLPQLGEAVVRADPAMVKVALGNLLGNAIKFTRTRIEARIELEYKRGGEEDVICLKDNGVGFDSRSNDKLFGVFKRLHGANQFEGTGIGLALVSRIMEKHGGRCWAEGQPGVGATIYLAFPAGKRAFRQAS